MRSQVFVSFSDELEKIAVWFPKNEKGVRPLPSFMYKEKTKGNVYPKKEKRASVIHPVADLAGLSILGVPSAQHLMGKRTGTEEDKKKRRAAKYELAGLGTLAGATIAKDHELLSGGLKRGYSAVRNAISKVAMVRELRKIGAVVPPKLVGGATTAFKARPVLPRPGPPPALARPPGSAPVPAPVARPAVAPTARPAAGSATASGTPYTPTEATTSGRAAHILGGRTRPVTPASVAPVHGTPASVAAPTRKFNMEEFLAAKKQAVYGSGRAAVLQGTPRTPGN